MTPNLSLRIGLAIRRLREDKGLTQQNLAEAAEVTQAMISHIETGRRNANFNLNALQKIAAALGIPKLSQLIIRAEKVGDLKTEIKKTRRLLRSLK